MSIHPHNRVASSRPRSPSARPSRAALAALMLSQDLVDHVQRMTRLLTDGDFESLVLWCALASRNGDLSAGPSPDQAAPIATPMALKDLVAVTGIPRETARRKLERMAMLGKVERVADGWVARVERLDPAMRPVVGESVRLIHEAVATARAALKLE